VDQSALNNLGELEDVYRFVLVCAGSHSRAHAHRRLASSALIGAQHDSRGAARAVRNSPGLIAADDTKLLSIVMNRATAR